MQFHELLSGAGYGFCGDDREPEAQLPCFVFETRHLSEVQHLVRGMYVELSLRERRDGSLSWCLDLPDRDVRPWAIPIAPADLPRLERQARAARSCLTFVRDPDGIILDLSEYCTNLEFDWSGRVSRALALVSDGALDEAVPLLERVVAEHPERIASAYHLLGRCHRVRGDASKAIACYHDAVRAAREVGNDRLVPYAAGPLSDMGVLFKRQGEIGRAVHCFMHSLDLRPNHPETLLSFFSLFPDEEKLVLFGAARVIALGGHDELVDQYLKIYGQATGRPADAVRAEAARLARDLDLASWPFHSEEFARLSTFERGLEREGAPASHAVRKAAGHKHDAAARPWLEALALKKPKSSC